MYYTKRQMVEMDGFVVTKAPDGVTVQTPLGEEYPVFVERTGCVTLRSDGYDNGVNMVNRVGQADELVCGFYSDDGYVEDDSAPDHDAGLPSRHGGKTLVYRYNREEFLALTPGAWALCLIGRVDGPRDQREFVLFVG